MKKAERWLELAKSLLILLLLLSAVWLGAALLIGDRNLPDLLPRQEAPGGEPGSSPTLAAALPAAMAVNTGAGRYGVQYDPQTADALFARLGPLLGEALVSAGEPRELSEALFRRALDAEGVYFDFAGQIPLSALSLWLGREESALPGAARRLLLAGAGSDRVELYWQDGEGGPFYACSTGLTLSLHLGPILADYRENGSRFAYEDPGLSSLLTPYTLIAGEEGAGGRYTASDPLSGSVGPLLSILSFSEQNHALGSAGEFYLDGSDRLQIDGDGSVTYRAAQGEKYPAPGSAARAVEAARDLAQRTVGAFCGAARLYLISAVEEENGLLVRFGYQLSGSAVHLYQDGWCAQFLIQDGYITEFTLRFRAYAESGEKALLLPVDRAAALLPALTDGPAELSVQYEDRGGAALEPRWVADRG